MGKVKDVKKAASEVVEMYLGGRMRQLKFDMNAFAELENRFGSIETAMNALATGQISKIRIVLWAALIHDEVTDFDEVTGEPTGFNITPFEVGSWIESPKELTDMAQLLGKAIGKNMPAPEDLPADVKAKMKAAGVELPTEDTAKNVKAAKNA